MADYSAYNADRTKKICRQCAELLPVESYRKRKRQNESYVASVCAECEAAGVAQYRTMTPKGRAAEIVRRCKSFCKTNNLPFDLTVPWVLHVLETSGWKCALTGLPMRKLKVEGEKSTGFIWDSLSIDRIYHAGGYTKSNVRFILNCVNMFRGNNGDDVLYNVARALVANEPHARKNAPVYNECEAVAAVTTEKPCYSCARVLINSSEFFVTSLGKLSNLCRGCSRKKVTAYAERKAAETALVDTTTKACNKCKKVYANDATNFVTHHNRVTVLCRKCNAVKCAAYYQARKATK